MNFDYYWEKAIDLIENSSKSLFLTGKAWTWKSTLIKFFLENTKKNVLVLASTWISAINIEWSTIHSFFLFHPWITLDEISQEYEISKNRLEILKSVDTVIIDEISMVRADMLDIIDFAMKKILQIEKIFWWKQMIFVWDLYQLPPIIHNNEKEYFEEKYNSPFFFSSLAYQELNPEIIELQKIYRQEDKKFINILNKFRIWLVQKEDIDYLNQRNLKEPKSDFFLTLVTTNLDANLINQEKLSELNTKSYIFKAKIEWQVPESYYTNSETIEFKPQSQIMMLTNWSNRKNWTLWKILDYNEQEKIALIEIDWEEYEIWPHTRRVRKPIYDKKQKTLTNEIIWTFTQMPFKLARAITIHKSQWLTFDNVYLDFGKKVFAGWQAYVALSRVRTLDWLFLKRELKKTDIHIDKRIRNYMWSALIEQKIEFIKKTISKSETIKFQYIKFNWDVSERIVEPLKTSLMNYQWNDFWWLNWFCKTKKENKIFHLWRIFELELLN